MKPSEASIENPVRLSGLMTWIYYDGGSDCAPVERALIRGEHDIVVECKWADHYYTVPLRSTDDVHFMADFDCKSASKTWMVRASGKLWSNKTGYLLFGAWVEDGHEMHWMVELQEVTST